MTPSLYFHGGAVRIKPNRRNGGHEILNRRDGNHYFEAWTRVQPGGGGGGRVLRVPFLFFPSAAFDLQVYSKDLRRKCHEDIYASGAAGPTHQLRYEPGLSGSDMTSRVVAVQFGPTGPCRLDRESAIGQRRFAMKVKDIMTPNVEYVWPRRHV